MQRKLTIGRHVKLARRLFAVTFLLGVATGQVAAQQNLGRLFFTEQERQDLDRRRQANIQETAVVVESTVTVNGQVSRSSGRSTTWINGVPQESARKPLDPARVTLPGGEGAPSVTLKIGQTLDKVRGEIRDPAASGRITTPSEERERKP
ncbi:MAG: hypothetical protein E6H45_08135 [Betaproteobacteria bacterium]|nr:MAG: hypothetical protein E6H45_08135 [Betaproteobacteria bacterium]